VEVSGSALEPPSTAASAALTVTGCTRLLRSAHSSSQQLINRVTVPSLPLSHCRSSSQPSADLPSIFPTTNPPCHQPSPPTNLPATRPPPPPPPPARPGSHYCRVKKPTVPPPPSGHKPCALQQLVPWTRCGGRLVSQRTWEYHNRSKSARTGVYNEQKVGAGDGCDAASARIGGDAAGVPIGGYFAGSAGRSAMDFASCIGVGHASLVASTADRNSGY